MVANTHNQIWARVVDAERGDLAPDAARGILQLAFGVEDSRRMAELSAKANEGMLSAEEVEEAEAYRQAADLLALLHSKARRSLQSPRTTK